MLKKYGIRQFGFGRFVRYQPYCVYEFTKPTGEKEEVQRIYAADNDLDGARRKLVEECGIPESEAMKVMPEVLPESSNVDVISTQQLSKVMRLLGGLR